MDLPPHKSSEIPDFPLATHLQIALEFFMPYVVLFGLLALCSRAAPVVRQSLSPGCLHLPLGHRSEVWVFSSSSPSAW